MPNRKGEIPQKFRRELPNYKAMRIFAVGVGGDAVAQRAAVDGAARAEFDSYCASAFEADETGVDAGRADGRIGGVDVAAPDCRGNTAFRALELIDFADVRFEGRG